MHANESADMQIRGKECSLGLFHLQLCKLTFLMAINITIVQWPTLKINTFFREIQNCFNSHVVGKNDNISHNFLSHSWWLFSVHYVSKC